MRLAKQHIKITLQVIFMSEIHFCKVPKELPMLFSTVLASAEIPVTSLAGMHSLFRTLFYN